jgi:outer membrane protein assembly factor BamB
MHLQRLLSALFLSCAFPLLYPQWPQWRGPDRDGRLPPSPASWPPRLELLWQRDVGEGHSGPVAGSDSVFTLSRRAGDEVVTCLRLSSGAVVWTASYPAPFEQDPSARDHGLGPFATPSIDAGRLFTFGITSTLSAWDAASGRLLWRTQHTPGSSFPYPYFGNASSPLAWNGRVFVHLGGHRRGDIEDPGSGPFVALDAATGRELWRWAADAPSIGSSPILCSFSNTTHLVFKTQKHIVGLNPANGAEFWRIPYRVAMDNTITTPVCYEGKLISSDYDSGFKAWRIDRDGNAWTPRLLWSHRHASLFTSSPVVAAGLLLGFSHFNKGQLFALEAKDGSLLWRGEPRSGEHATLLHRGDQLLVFLDDGRLLAGPAARTPFVPARSYRLSPPGLWAHPAFAGNALLIKHGTRLSAWRWLD